MDSKLREFVRSELNISLETMAAAARSDAFLAQICAISEAVITSLEGGGKILFAGNGGSAADAQHIAGEFVSRLNYDRSPLAGLALTTDTSVLTAIGNDYGFEAVFSRQVEGLARPGDVFVGISTSGRSPNIVAAFVAARRMGVKTVGFTSLTGGVLSNYCDLLLNVPSDRTPLIQQLHITAAHIVCGAVEIALFPRD